MSASGRLAAGLARELPTHQLAWHRSREALFHEREADALVVEAADPVDLVADARRITGSPLLAVGGGEREAAACLELGADAWLPNASGPGLVAAQVRAMIRGLARGQSPDTTVRLGRLHLDPGARRAFVAGAELELSPREFELLRVLAGADGRVMSRDRILASAWGPRFFGEPKTVDVHVAWLRPKLEGSGLRLTTLRGVGYRLDVLDGREPEAG